MKNNLTWSDLTDILMLASIVFLAYHDKDGWGWLIFIMILKHG
jgi:hypothetical protein